MLESLQTSLKVPTTNSSVLVVEDEALIALDLEERLVRLGYEVAGVVDNGADALKLAHAVKIDLVLMDIHLRGASDGIETAEALRRSTDIPVVFLTAHADDATLQRAAPTEPFGYVLKPFDERELCAAMQTALYRHRAESRLRKMERWLATTLCSIGDGVIATDSEGRVTFINAMAEAVTGWARGDAIGRHLSVVFVVVTEDGPEETYDLLHRAMTDGVTITLGEGRYLRTRDDRLLPVDDSISPIRDENGWITGCVVIFRDHTDQREAEKERRRLEEKMREAQRLESLGVLASGIAHDFNNLLMAVTCNASLGRVVVPEDSPAQPCFRDIEDAANRAALLCSQMLAYAGKSQMALKDVELSSFTRDTAQLLHLAIGRNADLSLDLAEGLPPLRTDPSQLQQIIMNLVINGSEALEGSAGELVVRTALFLATRAFLSGCRIGADLSEGDYLLLEVSDTGQGMTPEVAARIFDPFFTTKFTGRGLGMAAISGIVRNHGGALALRSTPGLGTTFQILFPPLDSTSVEALPPPLDLSWRGSGRALLVDDEPAIRLAGGALLRHLGFHVDMAEDGLQAVEKATAVENNYRVILLDLTMPKLGGHGAFQEIRKNLPTIPVLLMSGHSDQQAAELFELGGPVDFIHKPFSIDALSGKLQALLGS